LAIEKALAWYSENDKTLTKHGMTNWLHRVKPGSAEYIDPLEAENQRATDADWIRQVEQNYPDNPDMQAHYWYRQKNELGKRIPDGVVCRKMGEQEGEQEDEQGDEQEKERKESRSNNEA
jgi:hypothetical protein